MAFLVLAASAVVFSVVGLKLSDWSVAAYVAPLANIKYLAVVFFLGLLCSIAANMLVNYAAGRMSVAKISVFASLITLCSTFGGIVLLGEPFNALSLLGTAMIIVGVWQGSKGEEKKE